MENVLFGCNHGLRRHDYYKYKLAILDINILTNHVDFNYQTRITIDTPQCLDCRNIYKNFLKPGYIFGESQLSNINMEIYFNIYNKKYVQTYGYYSINITQNHQLFSQHIYQEGKNNLREILITREKLFDQIKENSIIIFTLDHDKNLKEFIDQITEKNYILKRSGLYFVIERSFEPTKNETWFINVKMNWTKYSYCTMELIEFYDEHTKPENFKDNHESINDIELLKSLVNENYYTRIFIHGGEKEINNVGSNFLGISKFVFKKMINNYKNQYIEIYNIDYSRSYGFYTIFPFGIYKDIYSSKNIFKKKITLTEEEFLEDIKPGSIMSVLNAENKINEIKNLIQDKNTLLLKSLNLVKLLNFKNYYIVKSSTITKPARHKY